MDGRGARDELSVAELVERYRAARDADDFAELYRRLRRRVFGAALRVVDDAGTAEELCHDAFVRAYARFPSFRGGEFAAWVCRIASNLALNALRRRRAALRLEAEVENPPATAGVERRMISRQQVEIAGEILAGLRPEQRRVFVLRQLEGRSHPEISALTGYSAGEVRSYLQNARRNFALLWRQRTGWEGDSDG